MKRVAVVGASGFVGAELVRLIQAHPELSLEVVCGNSRAGEPLGRVLPSLAGSPLMVEPFSLEIASRIDLAFCALPHGASAPIVAALRGAGILVLDLSADFRLGNRTTYEAWYGPHAAPERFGEGVYGLVELHRKAIQTADLIAVPGCYPTATLLALAPLFRLRIAEPKSVIVDAKSGVSGAGRGTSAITHFSAVAEGVRAYKAANHRHTAEIEEQLEELSNVPTKITFVPHLMPMIRGIEVTAYAALSASSGATPAVDATEAARELYDGSPSVVVHEPGTHPDTLWVRGSNRAHIAYVHDKRTGRIIAMSAIDNLLKGAAGQAIQCANVRLGFAEAAGLQAPAMWP